MFNIKKLALIFLAGCVFASTSVFAEDQQNEQFGAGVGVNVGTDAIESADLVNQSVNDVDATAKKSKKVKKVKIQKEKKVKEKQVKEKKSRKQKKQEKVELKEHNKQVDKEQNNNKYVERALKHNKDYQKLKGTIKLDKDIDKKLITKINFDDILIKAKDHAYDLQIGEYNVLIAKQGIKGARAEYFPKLVAMAGTEYTKNYRDVNETTVMSIGEAFINPYTRYQSVLGVTLSYNLFDFGVRGGNLKIAKKDVTVKELENEQKLQELNLTLVDTYAKIQMTQRQIEINKEILGLQSKNLQMKKRLFNAGELSKTELNDEEVKVAEVEKRIFELRQMLVESINWLQFYTGEQYDVEGLKVADIKKPDFDVMSGNDYTKSITWKFYEEQLKKKELELKVVQRMNYPKINAYGRYYLYGSDHSSYPKSFKDIGPSNLTVGANINMMLFDGMKNRANIHKTALEYKQLQVERDKAIAQLMTRLATMRSNLMFLDKQIEDNNKIIDELTDKEVSMKRLVSKKLASPIEQNEAKIKLLEQHIELEKNTITEIAIQRGIQILTQ